MLKQAYRTSSKKALKTTATPLSSDPANPTSSGDGTSFVSLLKQNPAPLGRCLVTADLPLLTLVHLVSCGWGELWKANHAGRCRLKLEVSVCCLCHCNCCHATPQRGLCFRDGSGRWGGVWCWLRCWCMCAGIQQIPSCLTCSWLKSGHVFYGIQYGIACENLPLV